MEPDVLKSIAGYIALAIPATVAISNIAKAILEWLKQGHAIKEAKIQQSHQITTHYLDRALDPGVPLAIRHQLLRFLATPDKDGSRMSVWAESELKRVGGLVEETNRAVALAEKELQEAKTAAELEQAERKLAEATKKQRSLLEAPTKPPVTAAAIRAGLVEERQLNGLDMKGENLSGSHFAYRKLRGSDFSEANLSNAILQGCDLRAAILCFTNLTKTEFYKADLRGANLSNAKMQNTSFHQARLEGVDLTGTILDTSDLRATYDDSTRWPDSFDPVKAGAVHVAPATESTDHC